MLGRPLKLVAEVLPETIVIAIHPLLGHFVHHDDIDGGMVYLGNTLKKPLDSSLEDFDAVLQHFKSLIKANKYLRLCRDPGSTRGHKDRDL